MSTAASFDNASPQWCRRLIAELDDADARATALVKGLSSPQLNWHPSPDSWSIGQCVEHLCITNHIYLEPIARALVGGKLGEVEEIKPGLLGRWFIDRYIEPSPTGARRRAPGKIVPPSRVEPSVLRRFLTSNDRARELIRSAGSHDVNRVRFRNPFVPIIHFTVGTGLEIVSRHQRRHLLQAERIRANPAFPPATAG